MSFLKKFYNYSPSFLRNLEGTIYSKLKKPVWKNPTFIKWYNFLEDSQWWSKEKLEEYQMRQLQVLLDHAYQNVPYYQKVFNERGLKPKDIQDFNDLKKLPHLTKKIIQENLSDLIARNWPKSKLKYVTTGGSTGIPLGFYQDKDTDAPIEWAFMLNQWQRVGYKIGDKSVVLRGNVVRSANKGKFWEYTSGGDLVLSSYHLTDDNLPKYIEIIRKFRPDFIQAFSSSVTILARFMKECDIKPFSSVKAMLCGSENLYDWQRQLFEEVFGCRIYSWYGHAERAALAGECEKDSRYHIFSEYGIIELIGKNSERVKKENELGEIVATSLNNFACPLIRYRTMDFAVPTETKCECGRNYSLLKKVEGRTHEFVITKTGRLISIAAINMHSPVFDNVKQFQFFQEKVGEVDFNIVPKETYGERDTDYIKKELGQKFGNDTKLSIKFVSKINRASGGKFMFLIQKLPIRFGEI